MKKLIIILSSFFLVLGLNAQDAEKDMKKAARLVGTYNLDPTNNGGKLDEAKTLIENAMSSGALNESSKAWNTQAKVYNELMNKDIQLLVLDPESELTAPDAPLKAYEGYANALKFAVKGFEKKDALKGMSAILANVNYLGSIFYQRQNFVKAYELFNATVEGDKLLVDNKELPFFQSDKERMDQKYYSGIAALSGEMMDKAKMIFEDLYAVEYENPAVYEALYKVKKDENMEEAEAILTKGREKFPDDVGMLYAEINHMLSQGRLDELIDRLKIALEKEPSNLSVMTTLGNVYDQLYQKANANGEEAKAAECFDAALDYFNQALGQDSDFFDANYSIGQLYYNKAAATTQLMNELANDYSKEGTAKYDEAKVASDEMFEKALPYFQKSEKINGKDLNTLIALKEIFARKNQFDKAEEYKAKIEAVNAEQ
jgi:hypothetical protein